MSIYLRPPAAYAHGPDGQGWNRLSLNAHIGEPFAQCALRPRRYTALHETKRGSRLARWGPYSPCRKQPRWGQPGGGDCLTCPVLTTNPRPIETSADRVLVRVRTHVVGAGLVTESVDTPYLVDDPDDGWASPSSEWTWEELARLQDWRIGRAHLDQHSTGFWLERSQLTAQQ